MAKSTRRVLVLVHPYHRPDRPGRPNGTEVDVWRGLRRLGLAVDVAAVLDDARALDRELARFRPHILFNLLEEFRGEGAFDFLPAAWAESLGLPCTGCNPRGLAISRNKWLVTAVAQAAGVPTPRTHLGARSKNFPAFVKFNREHASRGITRANVVQTPRDLARVARRLKNILPAELITQDFVRGPEVSVSAWGNARVETLPPRVLRMDPDRVATEKIKFDPHYRRRLGVRAVAYRGPDADLMKEYSARIFARLDLSGYARCDFRVGPEGPVLIDVNANPNLSLDEDFARSARAAGWDYAAVLTRIMDLARRYRPKI